VEKLSGTLDEPMVPSSADLLIQQQKRSAVVNASVQACGVKEHEG
jgi:hypothetical protein